MREIAFDVFTVALLKTSLLIIAVLNRKADKHSLPTVLLPAVHVIRLKEVETGFNG